MKPRTTRRDLPGAMAVSIERDRLERLKREAESATYWHDKYWRLFDERTEDWRDEAVRLVRVAGQLDEAIDLAVELYAELIRSELSTMRVTWTGGTWQRVGPDVDLLAREAQAGRRLGAALADCEDFDRTDRWTLESAVADYDREVSE